MCMISDVPIVRQARLLTCAVSSHFFRRGDAQEPQAVCQDGPHTVGQLQPGAEQLRSLSLDAAGPVEPVAPVAPVFP